MSWERWIINQRAVEGENGRSLWIRVEAVFDVWCQSRLMEFLLRRRMFFDWAQACARVYGIFYFYRQGVVRTLNVLWASIPLEVWLRSHSIQHQVTNFYFQSQFPPTRHHQANSNARLCAPSTSLRANDPQVLGSRTQIHRESHKSCRKFLMERWLWGISSVLVRFHAHETQI